MSVTLFVMLLICAPFLFGLFGPGLLRRRNTVPKGPWKVEPIVVKAVRDKNNAKFDGIRFRAYKGSSTVVSIDPPFENSFALDPSHETFQERIAEYRAHAKEVVDTLNANERLLGS